MNKPLSLLEIFQNNLTQAIDWAQLPQWPNDLSLEHLFDVIHQYSPTATLREIGEHHRELLNQQNKDGETLLHLAILAINRPVIQELLRFADPILTLYQANYLHYAYATSQEDIVELIHARFPYFSEQCDKGGDFPLQWLKYTPRKAQHP